MSRLVVALSMLLAAGSARAEWVKYSDFPSGTSYYDATTVRKSGDVARVWVFSDLHERMDGQWSRRALTEFDCGKSQYRTLRQTSFSGPMMSGEIDSKYTFTDPNEWRDVVSASPNATLLNIVCKR